METKRNIQKKIPVALQIRSSEQNTLTSHMLEVFKIFITY